MRAGRADRAGADWKPQVLPPRSVNILQPTTPILPLSTKRWKGRSTLNAKEAATQIFKLFLTLSPFPAELILLLPEWAKGLKIFCVHLVTT